MASSFEHGQGAPGVSLRDLAGRGDVPLRGFAVEGAQSDRSLSRLIESEIIPRLMNAHASVPAHIDVSEPIGGDEVIEFARLALAVEADELLVTAERMLARGVTPAALLIDLFGPAARVLGEYWKEDRCDFVDVTMALWRLQEVVHEIALRAPPPRRSGARRRAMFSAMPGDQHGFGALVVAEVFARAGWAVERPADAATRDLVSLVAGEWFDLVGLTVSCTGNTGALPSLLASLRSVSRNPAVRVMVGGPVFIEDPALADAVGADGTAGDARLALALADSLVLREAAANG